MNFKYLGIVPIAIVQRFYSITMDIMNFGTFVFLDLETTGLPQYEFGATKITELSLIAVQSDHIRTGILPRVQNKLSLCFNPRKLIQTKAAEITGLSNELLELQPQFSIDTVNLLQSFLNIQYQPVCLVAHNGNRFDFPILRTEMNRVNSDLLQSIMCVDSLPMFRRLYQEDEERIIAAESNIPIELMDGYDDFLCAIMDELDAVESKRKENVEKIQIENEKTPKRNKDNNNIHASEVDLDDLACTSNDKSSIDLDIYFNPSPRLENKIVLKKPTTKRQLFKGGNGVPFTLSAVYERLINKAAINTHRAECDTNLLLECAVAYGDRFISYSNCNAIPFSDIPLIQIGRKIGI